MTRRDAIHMMCDTLAKQAAAPGGLTSREIEEHFRHIYELLDTQETLMERVAALVHRINRSIAIKAQEPEVKSNIVIVPGGKGPHHGK